jgi:penicillin-binding protein 1C
MERIHPRHTQSHAAIPAKTVSAEEICWPLGKSRATTPSDLCHVTKSAWVLEQNFPGTFFDDKEWQSNPVTIWVDTRTGSRVDASCLPKRTHSFKKALWPLAVEPWIASQYRRNRQLPEFDERCQAPVLQSEQSIFIVGLEDHVILKAIRNDVELPTIQLSAQGGVGQLYWYINGQDVAITQGNELMRYQFKNRGKYQIMVIDSLGSTDMINAQVGY